VTRNILSSPYQAELARVAAAGCLLAVDFDGVLTQFGQDFAAAKVRASTLRLFDRLCRLVPCVVLSDHGYHETLARLERAPVYRLIANHGLEPADAGDVARWTAFAQRVLLALEPLLDGVDVRIEDKRLALSIHHGPSAGASVMRAARSLGEPCKLLRGVSVLHVLPPDAPRASVDLERVRERAGVGALVEVRNAPASTSARSTSCQVVIRLPGRDVLYNVEARNVDNLFHSLIIASLRARESRRRAAYVSSCVEAP
jgi:hypothetical protein